MGQKLVLLELELAARARRRRGTRGSPRPSWRSYRHWLEVVRLYRPHLLSEPEEKILAEKSVTGRSAWDRFFDETHSAARYELDGEEMSRDQILSKLYSPDRELRRRAAENFTAGLQELKRTDDLHLQHHPGRQGLRRPAAQLPDVDHEPQPGERGRRRDGARRWSTR